MGAPSGPAGAPARWGPANKTLLRIGAVTVAGLTLVFSGQPTGRTVIFLAVLLLVALALIEFLGQPPSAAALRPTGAPPA